MSQIEIYTKAFCGYCARAKSLLNGKEAAFTEFDITLGGSKRDEMLSRSNGRTSVPQIFINGTHIGGCDDMMALEAQGKLDALLKASG